ncbi:MAG: hypothetical protein ABTD50_10020 [Polyangiaceae bacterium]
MNRPGLAKAGALPPVLSRSTTKLAVPDSHWRSLFEQADIVSEGGVRQEGGEPVWYGTTSLILPTLGETARLAVLALYDIHARTRALRAARREACSRAPGCLGRFACEIHFSGDRRGVRIDVDVRAPLVDRTMTRKATR